MRYKKTIYTILAFSLLGMVWHYFFSYHSKTDIEIAQILGVNKVEIESFDYSESWNIQDYDVVEKYELSNSTVQRFLTSSSFVIFDDEYEVDSLLWGKKNWTKKVDSTKFETYYKMAFLKREDFQRSKWILEANKSLGTQDGYHSFYYKKSGNAVAFFVFDVKNRTLYIIYLKL